MSDAIDQREVPAAAPAGARHRLSAGAWAVILVIAGLALAWLAGR